MGQKTKNFGPDEHGHPFQRSFLCSKNELIKIR